MALDSRLQLGARGRGARDPPAAQIGAALDQAVDQRTGPARSLTARASRVPSRPRLTGVEIHQQVDVGLVVALLGGEIGRRGDRSWRSSTAGSRSARGRRRSFAAPRRGRRSGARPWPSRPGPRARWPRGARRTAARPGGRYSRAAQGSSICQVEGARLRSTIASAPRSPSWRKTGQGLAIGLEGLAVLLPPLVDQPESVPGRPLRRGGRRPAAGFPGPSRRWSGPARVHPGRRSTWLIAGQRLGLAPGIVVSPPDVRARRKWSRASWSLPSSRSSWAR